MPNKDDKISIGYSKLFIKLVFIYSFEEIITKKVIRVGDSSGNQIDGSPLALHIRLFISGRSYSLNYFIRLKNNEIY